jgi:hypothetical protein
LKWKLVFLSFAREAWSLYSTRGWMATLQIYRKAFGETS